MNPLGTAILNLLENVSLLAFVAAGHVVLTRRAQLPQAMVGPAIGILFGLGAVLAMTFRITVMPGVFVDGRNIMTSLAAVFGGPAATLITVSITVAYRFWLGGSGVYAGTAAAIASGLIGLAFCAWQRRAGFQLRAGRLLVLGVAVVIASAASFGLLNPAESAPAFAALIIPLLLVTPLGTMLLGLALQNEDERRTLQEKTGEQALLLDAIFRSIGKGIIVANERGEIVMSNPSARKLSAIAARADADRANIKEATALQLDGVTTVAREDLPINRAVRGESTESAELMITGPDGKLNPVNMNGRPLVDAAGRRRGGVVVFRDISHELKLQETVRKSERRLKDAIDVMENGFALFDAEDRLVACNAGFIDEGTRQTFGNPVGRTFEEIFRAFAKASLTAANAIGDPEAWLDWRMKQHRNPPREPMEIQWSDGRWMRVTERRTAEGGYVGIWTDITAVKSAETRLLEAVESIPEGFILMDSELRVKIFNRRMLELYPLTAPAFVVGQSFADVLRYGAQHGEYPGVTSPGEVESFVRQWMDRFSSDKPYFGEGAFRDGRWVLVSHRRTASGDYVSIRTDITAQKQRERELAKLLEELIESQAATERAHESLQRSSTLLRAITDAVPALVSYVDRDECYRYCNKEYRDIFGLDPESLVGQRIVDVIEPEVYRIVQPEIDCVLKGAETSFVRPMIAKGVIHYVEQRYIPNFAADGQVEGFYAIGWDITESYNRELALNREAMTDPLTGLLNRRGMTDALLEYAQSWRDGAGAGAVLYLDIDRFKQINDTMGHDVGDALIKAFADRLRGVVRSSDKVARQGGDEFVILLSAPNAEAVAKRIATTLLERIRQPVILGERVVTISTSIGIAVIKPGAAVGDLEMMKQADMALYEAKSAGRDRYCLRRVG